MSDRWSYQVIQVKRGTWGSFKVETMQAELSRMGAQGWELVSAMIPAPHGAATLIFKRPQ